MRDSSFQKNVCGNALGHQDHEWEYISVSDPHLSSLSHDLHFLILTYVRWKINTVLKGTPTVFAVIQCVSSSVSSIMKSNLHRNEKFCVPEARAHSDGSYRAPILFDMWFSKYLGVIANIYTFTCLLENECNNEFWIYCT